MSALLALLCWEKPNQFILTVLQSLLILSFIQHVCISSFSLFHYFCSVFMGHYKAEYLFSPAKISCILNGNTFQTFTHSHTEQLHVPGCNSSHGLQKTPVHSQDPGADEPQHSSMVTFLCRQPSSHPCCTPLFSPDANPSLLSIF